MSDDSPVLLVALRHFGCTFCRETLAQLAAERAQLESQGIRLAVLHSASAADAAPSLARAGLSDVSAFADHHHSLAGALGIGRGSFMALQGPRNVHRAIPALLAGHGIGYPVGDPLQMPGAFMVHRGRVISHHHHAFAGEQVDFRTFASKAGLASVALPAHT